MIDVTGLCWLAFLLTGARDISVVHRPPLIHFRDVDPGIVTENSYGKGSRSDSRRTQGIGAL
jgi:hypothetical protein